MLRLRFTQTATIKQPSLRSSWVKSRYIRHCVAITLASITTLWGAVAQAVSYSNAPANTVILPQAQIGPGTTLSLSLLTTPNATFLTNNITANINNNQTGVEVNNPIELTLTGGLNAGNTQPTNTYIVDSAGTVHYSRVEINNNRVILFPQVKLQPTRTYYAVFGGLVDANYNSYGNYIIKFTN